MSNDNLYSFLCSENENKNELFSLIAINRICQGIDYLQSNLLIHRDLKPLNILVDHDYLPYISDFETIRKIPQQLNDYNNEITNDIGSSLYTSLEQSRGLYISFPTDIYSFGLIIYFIYEKKFKL